MTGPSTSLVALKLLSLSPVTSFSPFIRRRWSDHEFVTVPAVTGCVFSARTSGAAAASQRPMQQTVAPPRPASGRPAAQPARNQNIAGGDTGRIDELELQVIRAWPHD